MRVCDGSPGHLLDAEVTLSTTCDLRKMGDRHDLRLVGEPPQRLADRVVRLPADARVDLVEDHRLAAAHRCDRERDPRAPARSCRRDRSEAPDRRSAHEERHLVASRCAQRTLVQPRDELTVGEADLPEARRHRLGEGFDGVSSCGSEG